jgi:pyridoxal 5'-phosphate synthase glutaminase subunit Pdx2
MGEERPRIGVLAIQGDFAAHAQALEEAGADAVEVRKPAELDGLDGLVLPGGESTTFLKFLERDGLLASLQRFLAEKPAFGTCAGCILLARNVTHPPQQSLELMDISVERNAYGRQIDSAIQTAPTQLPGGPLEMVYIRAPRRTGRVSRAGPARQVTGSYLSSRTFRRSPGSSTFRGHGAGAARPLPVSLFSAECVTGVLSQHPIRQRL